MSELIYLDYMSTTPVDPAVVTIMSQSQSSGISFGNSSSRHEFGKMAAQAIEVAQHQVAELIGASSSEIIWTSGATESNNMALLGVARFHRRSGNHIITVKTEHQAVLAPCRQLESEGFEVTYLNVDSSGVISLDELTNAIKDTTILVSIMHVNNETGVIQDLNSIASVVKKQGVLLHVDGAQSVGKIPLNLSEIPIDLLSVSAHKLYGPKGIGALFVRHQPRVRFSPLLFGSAQQKGVRPGTLPTEQIIGMGEAFNQAQHNWKKDHDQIQRFADLFLSKLLTLPDVHLNGDSVNRYQGCINVQIHGLEIETLMASCPQLAFSQGAACTSPGSSVSHVLQSMGLSRQETIQCVRLSFGRMTTMNEVEQAANMLAQNIIKLRGGA
jgi:cysteine desulfurase